MKKGGPPNIHTTTKTRFFLFFHGHHVCDQLKNIDDFPK